MKIYVHGLSVTLALLKNLLLFFKLQSSVEKRKVVSLLLCQKSTFFRCAVIVLYRFIFLFHFASLPLSTPTEAAKILSSDVFQIFALSKNIHLSLLFFVTSNFKVNSQLSLSPEVGLEIDCG